MAWRRLGDRPLSEPMMVSLLTHICVTRPQWINGWVCVIFVSQAMSNMYVIQCSLCFRISSSTKKAKKLKDMMLPLAADPATTANPSDDKMNTAVQGSGNSKRDMATPLPSLPPKSNTSSSSSLETPVAHGKQIIFALYVFCDLYRRMQYMGYLDKITQVYFVEGESLNWPLQVTQPIIFTIAFKYIFSDN